ncbi:MAG: restriction endonuclease [candidate division Zixibacteria bacterium]|nr:restriction endonuclease [candidate division Zixibacteria bacterium]
MRIVARFSLNQGYETVCKKYPHLLREIESIVAGIDASNHLTKISKEKTMPGQELYSPVALNKSFKTGFSTRGWTPVRVKCNYPSNLYVRDYPPPKLNPGAFREMDFVKEKLGVEIQFGKYSFMVYNVSAKMTIFHNLGHIDTGIEIVAVKPFVDHMSSGVSYFEQLAWDLEARGEADIDIPVLVLGIDA